MRRIQRTFWGRRAFAVPRRLPVPVGLMEGRKNEVSYHCIILSFSNVPNRIQILQDSTNRDINVVTVIISTQQEYNPLVMRG